MAEPYNIMTGPINDGRTLLANSASFRTLVGAADVTAALTHIFRAGIPESVLLSSRPYALLMQGSQRNLSQNSSDNYANSGSLYLHIEVDVPEAHRGDTPQKWEEAELWFFGQLGTIISEMLVLAQTGGYLAVNEVRFIAVGVRPHPTERETVGDHFWTRIELLWGVQ
jgi:hypothetical protein